MMRCLSCDSRHPAAALDAPCPTCGLAPAKVDGFVSFAPALAQSGGGFEPGYFANLAPREARSFWFRARSRMIVYALGRHARGFSNFLEIGCGTGYVLSCLATAFPGRRWYGSEIFSAGLGFARQRVPDAELVQLDATRLPFREEFDALGAFDVLEHIPDDVGAIAEAYAALRPGGAFVTTVPQHPSLWGPSDEYARHQRRYARTELQRKLEEAGFVVRFSTSIVALLMPMLVAARWLARRDAARDPAAELTLPRWLDRTLDGCMRVEEGLIRLGIRFPFGGSRLVLAEKPA